MTVPNQSVAIGTKVWGVLRLRCPVCWQGAMFRTPVHMNPRCPHCDYTFDKKHGYFLGAMYASYGISVAASGAVAIGSLVMGVPVWVTIAGVVVTACVVGPCIAFPYSRCLWVLAEREGHLHDGEEDPAALKRAYMEARGMAVPPDKRPPDVR